MIAYKYSTKEFSRISWILAFYVVWFDNVLEFVFYIIQISNPTKTTLFVVLWGCCAETLQNEAFLGAFFLFI